LLQQGSKPFNYSLESITISSGLEWMYYERPISSNVIIMHLGEGILHAKKMINARSLQKKCVDVEFVVLLFKKRRTCDCIIFQMKHKK
jgi:hypothetical protein